MIYQFNSPAMENIVPVPAQKVGERLEKIRRKAGRLTKEAVVEDARPVNSPLHAYFEWNDEVAGEKYRLEQARMLIKSIEVVVNRDQKTPVRAFVNVKEREDTKKAYTSISEAMNDPQLRAQVLDRAFAELENWKNRYRHLEEFADIIDAINGIKVRKTA